jgi:SAM-dependent methyltransferase
MNIKKFYELFPVYNKKVLELGCGKEHSYTDSLRVHNKVTPTDVVERNLKGFIKADARKLPFPDKSFDVVFAGHVLHHIPKDLDKAVKEIRRVLKPDGKFYGEEPNGKWLYFWIIMARMHEKWNNNYTIEEKPLTPKIIKNIFEKNGFDIDTEYVMERLPLIKDNLSFIKNRFSSCFVIRADKKDYLKYKVKK